MPATPVNLKDPVFSAVLAFLVPGLGHLHQRRTFKGVLYAVCILGTFFTGMRIGHGQVVYFNWQPSENRTYAYLCQFWVGLPALPALAQAQLRSPSAFNPNYVPETFESSFRGILLLEDGSEATVEGNVVVSPQQPDDPRRWSARLNGKLANREGALSIEGIVSPGGLEPQVGASPERKLFGTFEGHVAGKPESPIRGRLDGAIPRPLWDHYEVPLQDSHGNEFGGEPTELDEAHYMLGSRFELGVVFTMIAGLLNILAIYDALEGPAYEEDDEKEKGKEEPKAPPPT